MPSRRLRPATAAVLPVTAAALIAATLFLAACGGGPQANPEAVAPPAGAQAATADQADAGQSGASGDAASRSQQPAAATEDGQGQAASAGDSAAQAADQAGPIAYFVVGGDTLAGIADRFGVSLGALIAFNDLADPDALVVGQMLLIPSGEQAEPAPEPPAQAEPPPAAELPANVQLPASSTPWATPLRTAPSQFPQTPPDLVLADPPPRPERFLDYGAHALPWLQGRTEIDEIVELFAAWPMPALAVRPNRVYLIDTDGDGRSSVAIIFTNPDSFAADVPHSNLVVYDPLPGGDGPDTRYRIAYDHALAYGREPRGIEMISDEDLTGDDVRDLVFRELSCDRGACTSAYAVLDRAGDGYRVITGPDAVIADVQSQELQDAANDGAPDLVITTGDPPTQRRITLAVNGDALIQAASDPA